jgi:hypothetical protein
MRFFKLNSPNLPVILPHKDLSSILYTPQGSRGKPLDPWGSRKMGHQMLAESDVTSSLPTEKANSQKLLTGVPSKKLATTREEETDKSSSLGKARKKNPN